MKSNLKILDSGCNFLGLDNKGTLSSEEFILLPAPLELTTSYLKGTAKGPEALLQASHQVEIFDDELKYDTVQKGIATLAPMVFPSLKSENAMKQIREKLDDILRLNKKTVVVGGEHSVTIGCVRSFAELYPDLAVIHLDAHTDLRESYMGSPFNHACVMARVREICPFVSIGVRSFCEEEFRTIKKENLPVYDIHQIRNQQDWMVRSMDRIGYTVYVTIDLDVLDPSIMPAVGTPEPNGMQWTEFFPILRHIFKTKNVVGFDLVELCPRPGTEYGVFSAAKLLYRLFGYWFCHEYQQIP